MPNTVQFQKPRPKCRICGRAWHVITAVNPRSPQLGCCASCAVAARRLFEWFIDHDEAELQRMAQVVREAAAARQSARPLLERMA